MNMNIIVESQHIQLLDSIDINLPVSTAVALKKMLGRTSINSRINYMELTNEQSLEMHALHQALKAHKDIDEDDNNE